MLWHGKVNVQIGEVCGSHTFCEVKGLCALCAVVPWGKPPLPEYAHHSCGHQARLARGQRHGGETAGAQAGPYHLPTRAGHGQGNRGRQVPRVLCPHPEGPQERLRRGHPRCPLPTAQAQEAEAMFSPLKGSLPPAQGWPRTSVVCCSSAVSAGSVKLIGCGRQLSAGRLVADRLRTEVYLQESHAKEGQGITLLVK